jgi:hypothetical protein
MNTSYLKELYTSIENNNSLVLLNQKQLKDNCEKISQYLTVEKNMKGLIISYSYPSEILLNETTIQKIEKDNLIFIDLNSDKSKNQIINGFNVINIENPSNLTSLEINIEKFLKEKSSNKFIIFESISALSTYVNEKLLQKFIYYLNNKVSLSDSTLIILTIKDSTTEKTLNLVKQFSDKTYDFSEIFTSEVENVI